MQSTLNDFSEYKKLTCIKILEVYKKDFKSLREISEALDMNKNTIQAHYIYPMASAGLLKTLYPKGVKAHQRYIAIK